MSCWTFTCQHSLRKHTAIILRHAHISQEDYTLSLSHPLSFWLPTTPPNPSAGTFVSGSSFEPWGPALTFPGQLKLLSWRKGKRWGLWAKMRGSVWEGRGRKGCLDLSRYGRAGRWMCTACFLRGLIGWCVGKIDPNNLLLLSVWFNRPLSC